MLAGFKDFFDDINKMMAARDDPLWKKLLIWIVLISFFILLPIWGGLNGSHNSEDFEYRATYGDIR